MKKINTEKIKDFVYNLTIKIIYLIIISAVIFSIYKIFAWDKIKARLLNKNEVVLNTEYNLPIQNKDRDLSYEEEKTLNDLMKRFKRQEIIIDKIDVVGPDALLYKEGTNFYIKISFRNNIEKTWNSFVSAYLSSEFKKDFQNDLNNIEYIDLRFSNKVFYKKVSDKTNEPEQELLATSTATSTQ